MERGVLLPLHHGMTKDMFERLHNCIDKFISENNNYYFETWEINLLTINSLQLFYLLELPFIIEKISKTSYVRYLWIYLDR